MNTPIHKMFFINNDYYSDMCVYHYNIQPLQITL